MVVVNIAISLSLVCDDKFCHLGCIYFDYFVVSVESTGAPVRRIAFGRLRALLHPQALGPGLSFRHHEHLPRQEHTESLYYHVTSSYFILIEMYAGLDLDLFGIGHVS